MRETMSRVESTSPPGVRKREDDERGAGAVGAVERLDHVFGGDRVDDAVDHRGVDDGWGW